MSMAAHLASDLEDCLDGALAWRRIEMHALKSSLESESRKSSDGPLTRALSRSVVAISYAHWEGYAKEAFQAYVRFIARRRPRISSMNDGLLLSCLLHLARRVTSGDAGARTDLVEIIRRLD